MPNYIDINGLTRFFGNISEQLDDKDLVIASALVDLDARVKALEDAAE